jgi:16S rRNA (adenine1518-N6/adenine1519-N6)-dimethyltransferase
VTSTVVRLNVRSQIAAPVDDEALLWRIVSAGFAQRRKTIFNNLRAAAGELSLRIEQSGGTKELLMAASVEPQRRAETLSLEEWARLANAMEGKR